MYIAAQIVGILAVATYLLSYQLKKRKHIIAVNATSSFLYVLQYILLGALEGAAIDVLSAVGAVTAHNKDKKLIAKHTKLIIILLNLLFLATGLALYKNVFSLFPIAGAILQMSAFWITSEKRIRQVSFLGTPFWLTYNIACQAYGSVIGSVLCMVSIGSAIYRYDIYPKRKK
ncbi:MAG: YgjV family protein [Oscillospiraceae bacterium]|nr:YgjV family protein [Oscillospiraceae bacterium]